jgi:hypothetical protein
MGVSLILKNCGTGFLSLAVIFYGGNGGAAMRISGGFV